MVRHARNAVRVGLACAAVLFTFAARAEDEKKPESAPPTEVKVGALDAACRKAIAKHAPDKAKKSDGPEIYRDRNGHLTVAWSRQSGKFYAKGDGESQAAWAIAKDCADVVVVSYSGATGGAERWYIRRDDFKVRHSRDSGMPGDEDKYSGWDTVPFDYDPAKNYGEPQ